MPRPCVPTRRRACYGPVLAPGDGWAGDVELVGQPAHVLAVGDRPERVLGVVPANLGAVRGGVDQRLQRLARDHAVAAAVLKEQRPGARVRDVAERVDRRHGLFHPGADALRGRLHELRHRRRAAGDQHQRVQPSLDAGQDGARPGARAPTDVAEAVRVDVVAGGQEVERSPHGDDILHLELTLQPQPVERGGGLARHRRARRGRDRDGDRPARGEPERRADHRVAGASGAVDVDDGGPLPVARRQGEERLHDVVSGGVREVVHRDRVVLGDDAPVDRAERPAGVVGERPLVDRLAAAAACRDGQEQERRRGGRRAEDRGSTGRLHGASVAGRGLTIRDGDYAGWVEVAGVTAQSFEQRIRELEERSLSPLAVRSYDTVGRERPEEPCAVRTPFQRDRDRLVHSKPFRRLKGKTQVFIDPEGDHYRTRMTHTLETTAISRVVGRALRLNEDLVEAIGLGHDTGHTPFGHAGEQALDDCLSSLFGVRFRHNEQSHRIARRLNLTREVCDGILTHTGAQEPHTLEGKIVRLVDRVAYINHDIDDAIRYGILRESDLPAAEIALLGPTGSQRIDTLVHDIVEASEAAGDIRQSDEIGEAMLSLRAFMFDRVYLGPHVEPEHRRAHDVIRSIFERLVAEPELLPPGPGELPDRIMDYVAGMTDRFALAYARTS